MSTETTQPKALPRKLFGYEVIERLGEGAASTIYAVTDRKTSQVYALKHVIRHTDRDLRFIRQLENEWEVSRLFRHHALRRCIDFRVSRSLLFKVNQAALVMELVDGVPLDQQKPKELPAILDCFTQVAQAIGGLHYLLYVHCDLKPNNILTDAQGRMKLIDFGQAAKIGTVKERIQGTPDFIAPEQVKLKPVTPQTDVYSFGATLYWALSGQRVPTLFTVKRDQRDIVIECKFPSPRDLNPDVPQELSDLVMSCVQMNPMRRPADMAQILTHLDRIRTQAAG